MSNYSACWNGEESHFFFRVWIWGAWRNFLLCMSSSSFGNLQGTFASLRGCGYGCPVFFTSFFAKLLQNASVNVLGFGGSFTHWLEDFAIKHAHRSSVFDFRRGSR